MKTTFKALFSFILIIVLIVPMSVAAFAMPTNEGMLDSYYYDNNGKAVAAPLAYRAVKTLSQIGLGLPLTSAFTPVDLFANDQYVYIVDKTGNRIVILDTTYQVVKIISSLSDSEAVYDEQGNVVEEAYTIPKIDATKYVDGKKQVDSELANAKETLFNSPQGIYVDSEGLIYVADTNNRRIVCCDINGHVKKVIQSVKVSVLGKEYIFKPIKIVVDRSGGMQVIAYGVNRGIMELDYDGTFCSFIGAPPVTINAVDWFWRSIATEEQKKKLVKYVPTEYCNMSQDSRGFIYCTVSTIEAKDLKAASAKGSTTNNPVVKLNSAGSDILRRTGVYSPVGDLEFLTQSTPKIVDVASYSNGNYVILDQTSGRFFTYDNDGNFLYMGGGSGSQFGRTKNATSICVRGDEIYISDLSTNTIVVYESTPYAQAINKAVEEHTIGNYEIAEKYWEEVINYNSNMYVAYIGLGKAEFRQAAKSLDKTEQLEHYQKSLDYFELANEKTYYSQAFEALQKESLKQNFTLIAIVIIAVVVALIALYFILKAVKKKKGGRY